MTTTMDQSGRVVLPLEIREQLHLTAAARLNVEVVGDKILLSEAPAEARLERRGKRRVIVGLEGFDAVQAISEARAERRQQLEELA